MSPLILIVISPFLFIAGCVSADIFNRYEAAYTLIIVAFLMFSGGGVWQAAINEEQCISLSGTYHKGRCFVIDSEIDIWEKR